MLRISVHNQSGTVTFKLEGKLSGSWVQELEDCWRSVLGAAPKVNERFDLTEVTYIDAAGKAFLAARHAQGAQLVAVGCQMRAIVAEITRTANSNRGCLSGGGKTAATN
jgi:hypothetical protein